MGRITWAQWSDRNGLKNDPLSEHRELLAPGGEECEIGIPYQLDVFIRLSGRAGVGFLCPSGAGSRKRPCPRVSLRPRGRGLRFTRGYIPSPRWGEEWHQRRIPQRAAGRVALGSKMIRQASPYETGGLAAPAWASSAPPGQDRENGPRPRISLRPRGRGLRFADRELVDASFSYPLADWITADIAERLYPYMGGIVRAEKGVLYDIGGVEDHVHMYFRWRPDATVSDLMRTVKARSSKWVHDMFPALGAFAWQEGYSVFSVSKSQEAAVKKYIAGQYEHHRKEDFKSELLRMLRVHEIEFDERYVFD